MTYDQREQGETRQQIIDLLRRRGWMTAIDLGAVLHISAVGVRQHLGVLERDGLVRAEGVRRGVGRPSRLYALTPKAEELFPRRYDRLVQDALAFVEAQGGAQALEQLFDTRRQRLLRQFKLRLSGRHLSKRVSEMADFLNEQGYMCEYEPHSDGSFTLIEHNCPIDCVARDYHQACTHELKLYADVLETSVVRDETIAEGGNCCRYKIGGPLV